MNERRRGELVRSSESVELLAVEKLDKTFDFTHRDILSVAETVVAEANPD
jgi:hypothetical protein